MSQKTSQPYRVDIAPGLLDDLGRYVSSGTAALVVTEEHVAGRNLHFFSVKPRKIR